jgi:ferrous iron transport protein A
MEMGVLPGTVVELIRRAPLGDPLELCLRGYRLSIRESEARHIEVERLERA